MKVEVNGVSITLTKEQLEQIEIQKNNNSPEKLFESLIQGIDVSKPVVDFEKYPNSIFWFKGDTCFFEYDFKTKDFWSHSTEVWSKFYPYFNNNYSEIQHFIKMQVEKHFKLKTVTPYSYNGISHLKWKSISN